MARKTLFRLFKIGIVLGVLAVVCGGVWYYNRGEPAIIRYRVELEPGQDFDEVLKRERELFHSEDVLLPVVTDLGLMEHWQLKNEQAAVEKIRKKLKVKKSRRGDFILAIYRAPTQEEAFDVLAGIRVGFERKRTREQNAGRVPPIVPRQKPGEIPKPGPESDPDS